MFQCEKQCILKGTPSIVDTNLVITLPNVSLLQNRDVLRFVICSTIDQTNPLGTVSIVINGTTFPLKTKLSNPVRTEQLRSRRVYTIQLGAATPNFTMLTCLPETSFVYPTYPATAVAAEG